MATPTPSTNTPQKHLAALSSPAPRSVPPMNFDSPAVMNMLGEGGVGMGISMSGMGLSQLGLTASQLGRADEEERRRRLQNIIAMLNERQGRVSEEGLIALCKKEGVEFERAVEGDGSVILTLVIGNEAMCDITILHGDVTSVKLELASDDDNIFKESGSRILFKNLTPQQSANKINLKLDHFANNLEKLLRMDKLSAENGNVACYKAIFKVYGSLKRLFDHEKKMALALMDANAPNAGYRAEREVLCKKSGRPRINAGYCLGLSLEYWMDRRHLISKKPKETPSLKGKEKMDVDSEAAHEYPEDTDPTNNKIYSLTVECESSPSSMYTPIRIPDSWISEAVEKAPDAPDADINNILLNTSQIDWLDPKPTYLEASASTGDQDAMNLDNAPGRLPNIRFVAKFNPPLVVPLTVYIQIMQSVGLEYNPQDLRATTFVGLAIRPDETDPGMSTTAGGYTAEVRGEKKVVVPGKDGKETRRAHANSLYIPKLEYSRTLESLPFQHPRQLVELLPTLRQYAFTTSLLQDMFGKEAPKAKTAAQTSPLSPPLTPKIKASNPPLQLDLSLSYTQPAPRINIHIPHPSKSSDSGISSIPSNPSDLLAQLLSSEPSTAITTHPPLKIVLDIFSNAEIVISEQNVVSQLDAQAKEDGGNTEVDMERAEQMGEKVKRVGKALDVCGDLGIWAEWIRREVLQD